MSPLKPMVFPENTKNVLVPFVLEDGSFDERRVHPKMFSTFKVKDVVKSGPNKGILKEQTFSLLKLRVKLDEARCSAVAVYVSQDFDYQNSKEDLRKDRIMQFLKNKAAWIFTYGERKRV